MDKERDGDVKLLGSTEELMLRAIIFLGPIDAHGNAIQESLLERASRKVSVGALYATLDRLETKGFIESEERKATMGNRVVERSCFTVTGLGIRALERSEIARNAFVVGDAYV